MGGVTIYIYIYIYTVLYIYIYIGALVDLTASLSNHRHHVMVLLDLVALNLAKAHLKGHT